MHTPARGFTMVECILGVVLTAIIALSLAPLTTQGLNTYVVAANRARLLNDVRFALSRMAREILFLRPGDLRLIQPARITFVDQSGQPADYGLVANGARGTLFRTANVVLNNVNAVQFAYLDGGGNPTNVIANVRRINVQMTANTPVAGVVTLRTEIVPRNFAYANFR